MKDTPKIYAKFSIEDISILISETDVEDGYRYITNVRELYSHACENNELLHYELEDGTKCDSKGNIL